MDKLLISWNLKRTILPRTWFVGPHDDGLEAAVDRDGGGEAKHADDDVNWKQTKRKLLFYQVLVKDFSDSIFFFMTEAHRIRTFFIQF